MNDSQTSCPLCHVQDLRIEAENKAQQAAKRVQKMKAHNAQLQQQLEVSVHEPVMAYGIQAAYYSN
jgi:hypothetical protein